MFDIMNPTLAIVAIVMAVALPIVIAMWRALRGPGGWVGRLGRGVGVLAVVALAQIVALVAVFLHVNNTYAFYTSWEELLGEAPAAPTHDLVGIHEGKVTRVPITKSNPHPDGLLAGIRLQGTDAANSHIPVWLPPQYFEKSQARTRFPVLYVIGGLGDTGDSTTISVPAIGPAAQLVKEGKVNPFAIAFLPGRIRTGVDSECTDVGGYNHETWILRTVLPHVEKHYRLGRTRDLRFIAGWSTGAYCAANFTVKHSELFKAGFGLAPYFHPTYEEPLLSKVQQATITDNSPILRVKNHTVPTGVRFLSVMSKTDLSTWGDAAHPALSHGQVWADGQDFWNHAHGMSQFSFILLPSGGHRASTYTPYLGQCLRWLGQYGL